jgi:glutathione synthase/RimK-type ligase-like ATP-grasp enzyme
MNHTNQILIIGRNFHPDGKETAALIASELNPYLKKMNLGADLALFKDLIFDISNDGIKVLNASTGRDLSTYDVVLMTNWFSHASIRKDIAHTLALYFNQHGIKLFNSEALYSRSTSKLSQMMLAAINKVPIPRTIFSLSLDNLETYLKDIEFKAPFIFKDAQASRGKSNFVLKSVGEITSHKELHSEKAPFMAQDFIESDGSDLRFFVAGGDTKVIIKRVGQDDSHLHNTSAGAVTEILPIGSMDPKILKDVSRMSDLLHRELTGIDIMFDRKTGQYYFLEANPIPQIATGSNVELKLKALASSLEVMVKGE